MNILLPSTLRGAARVIAALAALSLAGCKHAQVTPIEENAAPAGLSPAGLAPTIYVAPFATNAAQVQVDPGGPLRRLENGEPLLQRQRGSLLGGLFNPHGDQQNPYQTSTQVSVAESQASDQMQQKIIRALQDRKIAATSELNYQPGMVNSLLLTGQFLTINQGDKMQRIAIGLGVGASYLETQAQLRDLGRPEQPPLLMFHTQADSGMTPGAAVSGGAGAAIAGTGAIGAGVSGFRQSQTGTGEDVANTASQIADYLKKYYQQQGWLPPDAAAATPAPDSTSGSK
jgi:hypothetical protein